MLSCFSKWELCSSAEVSVFQCYLPLKLMGNMLEFVKGLGFYPCFSQHMSHPAPSVVCSRKGSNEAPTQNFSVKTSRVNTQVKYLAILPSFNFHILKVDLSCSLKFFVCLSPWIKCMESQRISYVITICVNGLGTHNPIS